MQNRLGASLKHKNTQPLSIFYRENPQNSEPKNGPRRGLDFIGLIVGTYLFKNIIVATFTIAFLVDNNVVFAQEVIFRFRITRECASMVTIVFVR